MNTPPTKERSYSLRLGIVCVQSTQCRNSSPTTQLHCNLLLLKGVSVIYLRHYKLYLHCMLKVVAAYTKGNKIAEKLPGACSQEDYFSQVISNAAYL